MASSSIVFGTDGWHAVMDEHFTGEQIIRIAHAFVRSLRSQPVTGPVTVAVGYDGRRSSKHAASLFADVLSSYGVHVLLSGSIIPTPVLSFAVTHLSCTAGVMITAGNHPPHFSGIAFKVSDGGPFKAEETQRIASHITADAGTYTPVAEYIVRADFIPPYLARVRTLIDFSRLRAFGEDPRNHAALIIDSMGGAGQTLIEDLLAPCGWRAQTIFGAADENFYDRTPKAVSEFLEPLNYNVRVTDTLFGVATDGDADRCGIVYDDGQWMDAKDAILALAWHLCEHKKWQGGIVAPPPVAETLLPLAEHWGVPVIEAAAGYNHVIEVMRASQCMVGGDGSGGFGYARHMPARDGILTALLFAEMIAMSGLSLRAIVDALHARAFL